MNTKHKDINKFVPYGEAIRGFANQKYISSSEIHRILKERGIFPLNQDKDYIVPILQTLLLTPKEFDKIREAFSEKEDNDKKFSREITWNNNIELFDNDIQFVNIDDFIKKQLPTCKLEKSIRFTKVDNNPNHLIASFTINRHDFNKSWYEQTNQFSGSVEFVNDNGKGYIKVTHTAPETKEIAEKIIKRKIEQYKERGAIPINEQPKKILFSEFTNADRFVFFFRLTTNLENESFTCEEIKDISMKPQDDCLLPKEINWMEKINKMIISGKSLNKKFFIQDSKFHNTIILWNIDAVYSYEFKGERGSMTVNLGFPDYISKGQKAEFEINISSLNNNRSIDVKDKKKIKSQLLSEMDKQKSIVYNKFVEYLRDKK